MIYGSLVYDWYRLFTCTSIINRHTFIHKHPAYMQAILHRLGRYMERTPGAIGVPIAVGVVIYNSVVETVSLIYH